MNIDRDNLLCILKNSVKGVSVKGVVQYRLTLTPLTPLQSSNVVNRLYSNSLTTDKAEDERSYKGVIAKN